MELSSLHYVLVYIAIFAVFKPLLYKERQTEICPLRKGFLTVLYGKFVTSGRKL